MGMLICVRCCLDCYYRRYRNRAYCRCQVEAVAIFQRPKGCEGKSIAQGTRHFNGEAGDRDPPEAHLAHRGDRLRRVRLLRIDRLLRRAAQRVSFVRTLLERRCEPSADALVIQRSPILIRRPRALWCQRGNGRLR